ncbi:MAG: DUF4105 domain-containing protein [Elusimicrobiales bacterium]|nr:DUF4105 domain-containing protein [Elusimicrobiales bacterium]
MRADVIKALALFSFLLLFPFKDVFSLTSAQQMYEVELIEKSKNLNLSSDPYWLKLLYYEKTYFKGYVSENINPDFFLSKYGKYSPESELFNHIIGFFYEGDDNQSPECKFPERYWWLRKKLNIDTQLLPPRECSDFKEWQTLLKPYSISIVFASGYLSNPSTLYGHTFFLLKKSENKNSLLLDYTMNYAATTGDEKGLLYALKGVFGNYPGNFSTMPYYLKIQEYQNMENRDLWEYPLNLTQYEIDSFLRHSWELGKASFPYYFFKKNCSYQLLPILEISREGASLQDNFLFWNIPSDSLKVIVENFGDKKNFIYRPSLYYKVKSKISNLNPEEERISLAISKSSGSIALLDSINNTSQIKAMDTAIDYLSFRQNTGEISREEMDLLMDPILIKMSKTDYEPSAINVIISTPSSPVEARDSMLVGAGIAFYNRKIGYDINIRTALCDLLDDNDGYINNSVLRMGDLKLSYIPELNKFFIKEFTFADVLSLNPIDSWFKKASWGIKLGYYEYDRNKKDKNSGVIHGETSRGVSFENEFKNMKLLLYLLARISLDYSTEISNNFRAGLGPVAGLTFDAGRIKFVSEISDSGYINDNGTLRKDLGISYITSQNTSLKLRYSKLPYKEESSLMFNLYLFP